MEFKKTDRQQKKKIYIYIYISETLGLNQMELVVHQNHVALPMEMELEMELVVALPPMEMVSLFFSPMPLLLAYGTMGIEMAIAPLFLQCRIAHDSCGQQTNGDGRSREAVCGSAINGTGGSPVSACGSAD